MKKQGNNDLQTINHRQKTDKKHTYFFSFRDLKSAGHKATRQTSITPKRVFTPPTQAFIADRARQFFLCSCNAWSASRTIGRSV